MSYSETLVIRVPLNQAATAAAIGRAFDPDVGGERSFTEIEGELVCSTPCTPEFKAQALALLGDAAALHAACTADYAQRWADMTPPTLVECEGFLANVTIT